jgi:chorismate synthase
VGSNTFGTVFKVTTWGESHGKAIGVVIDGCPSGLAIAEEEINQALARRRPGNHAHTSPRKEEDHAQILSGIFEGKTTGAPISILIANQDVDSSSYEAVKHLLKPGHAQSTYLAKYGIFDYRGGGRASARETACRVAAGAIAKKILEKEGVRLVTYLKEMGEVSCGAMDFERVHKSPLFCPDEWAEGEMIKMLDAVKQEGDSLGGIVEHIAFSLPAGLGDPVYEKLEANLAKAILSIPASKGIEFGAGFEAARMKGSEHNDSFGPGSSNSAGGTLGGISTGKPLIFRVPFKPTSSIGKPQATLDLQGNPQVFQLSAEARHDPCVAIRAVPVVEAMSALVLVDALLVNQMLQHARRRIADDAVGSRPLDAQQRL